MPLSHIFKHVVASLSKTCLCFPGITDENYFLFFPPFGLPFKTDNIRNIRVSISTTDTATTERHSMAEVPAGPKSAFL
jgi:hypothetical protein